MKYMSMFRKMSLPLMRQFLVCHTRLILGLFLVLAIPAHANPDQEKTIVASIRPLTFLLNDLVLPSDKVIQLVKNNNSAHHFQLNVSDRMLLQSAGLVVWIGPDLEIFLEKPLQQVKLRGNGTIVTLSDAKGIQWIENENHLSDHDHDRHHHARDPHIWLNPINIQTMVTLLSKRLIQLSPDNAEAYQLKADNLINELTQLDKELKDLLAPLHDKPFTVLHPAYSHFINRYHLNQLDYVVKNPESTIGAKHLYELSQLKTVCLFGEVGQSNQNIQKIATLSKAKSAQLDPLGLNLADNSSITHLIRNLANDLYTCLN